MFIGHLHELHSGLACVIYPIIVNVHKSRHPQPTRVGTLLGRHLRSLLEVLDQQRTLLAEVRQRLPGPLHTHITGVQLQPQRLVLHADSPAWASRLRYQVPALTESFRALVPDLKEVKVRIQPPQAQPSTPTKAHKARLSPQAARYLLETADGLQEPSLSAALQKLARLAKD